MFFPKMIQASLAINIAVLIPICFALALDAQWVQYSYGNFSPARGILLSIYLSIIVASILLFFKQDPKFVATLLFVQVVYKLTTPLTVGTMNNPVVVSNLLIALFHTITIYTIWKTGKL